MSLEGQFVCAHCHKHVTVGRGMGTQHRNHCPYCLWSMHMDAKKPGDRMSDCPGLMKPIGIMFKDESGQHGELMLVHECVVCQGVGKNRIAGDDKEQIILDVFTSSLQLSEEQREKLALRGMILAVEKDREEIETQLFGKKL